VVPVTCLVFPHITPSFPSRGLHGWVGGGYAFSCHFLFPFSVSSMLAARAPLADRMRIVLVSGAVRCCFAVVSIRLGLLDLVFERSQFLSG
jgi:hypothetical protein